MTILDDLQRDYCPPLDSATVLAIASDFESLDDGVISQIRTTLNALKASAEEEELSGFDPSGSGGIISNSSPQNDYSEQLTSTPEAMSRSRFADSTNLTSGLSSLDINSASGSGSGFLDAEPNTVESELNELSTENKLDKLRAIFPSLKSYTIAHALQKCDGNVDRAIDLLLNSVYFQERDQESSDGFGNAPKGIDGFIECQNHQRGRKRKTKRTRHNHDINLSSSSSGSRNQDSDLASGNTWQRGQRDVEFVTSRTFLAKEKVASAYHANSASLAFTLHCLVALEEQKCTQSTAPQDDIETQLAELAWTFDTLSSSKLAALLRLTRHSPSAARDLAEVMVQAPDYIHETPQARVNPQHGPIDFRSENKPESQASRHRHDYSSVLKAQAAIHGANSAAAFSQASAAYRRGKSKPLMGLASQYYADEGRKHAKARAELNAAAADAYVQERSSATGIDLHGISVADAVRISKEKVRQWWDGLGDAKHVPGGGPAREGFEIVVGKGTHSRAGAARIGPAVLKQLTADGWRVEALDGFLRVTGRPRR